VSAAGGRRRGRQAAGADSRGAAVAGAGALCRSRLAVRQLVAVAPSLYDSRRSRSSRLADRSDDHGADVDPAGLADPHTMASATCSAVSSPPAGGPPAASQNAVATRPGATKVTPTLSPVTRRPGCTRPAPDRPLGHPVDVPGVWVNPAMLPSSWCSRASSRVRPTNQPVVTWSAMSALVCRGAAAEQGGAI
jgi:hypothetical protein